MKLIYNPSVYLIGQPQLNMKEIDSWVEDCGYQELLQDEKTPLSKFYQNQLNGTFSEGDALIEFAGRQCYRSFKSGRDHSSYIRNILEQEHGSVMEHSNYVFAITGVSRSLTHELVRHRVGVAISQESQRYVDAKDMNFVVPPLLIPALARSFANTEMFEAHCQKSLNNYLAWQTLAKVEAEEQGFVGTEAKKRACEAARWCLPNATETRLVWTANIRSLRHILSLRGGLGADLEIERLALQLVDFMKSAAPEAFSDMEELVENNRHYVATKYKKV